MSVYICIHVNVCVCMYGHIVEFSLYPCHMFSRHVDGEAWDSFIFLERPLTTRCPTFMQQVLAAIPNTIDVGDFTERARYCEGHPFVVCALCRSL